MGLQDPNKMAGLQMKLKTIMHQSNLPHSDTIHAVKNPYLDYPSKPFARLNTYETFIS